MMLGLELFSFFFRIHMAQLLAILIALLHGHQLATVDGPLARRHEVFALQLGTLLHFRLVLDLVVLAGLDGLHVLELVAV